MTKKIRNYFIDSIQFQLSRQIHILSFVANQTKYHAHYLHNVRNLLPLKTYLLKFFNIIRIIDNVFKQIGNQKEIMKTKNVSK